MTKLSARAYFEPHSESRPDIAERDAFCEANRDMLAREKRILRKYAIVGGVVVALAFVSLLFLTWNEQAHMTPRQQQTIGKIVN